MSGLQPQPTSSSVVPSAPSVQIPALILKHTIQKHVQYNGILRGVCHKLETEIPELQSLKLSPELTKLVANTIEAIVEKGNPFDIDKQQLVVEILTKEFLLSPEKQFLVNQQISFLFDNGQIKRVKNWLSLFVPAAKYLRIKFNKFSFNLA